MKVKFLLLILFGLLFVSCGHGQLTSLPSIESSVDAAEIFIIREGAFVGGGASYKVSLDGQDIVLLHNGSYTKFKVAPGPHQLSWGNWKLFFGWQIGTTDFQFSANQQYYLLIEHSLLTGARTFKTLTENEAQEYLADTKFIPINQ